MLLNASRNISHAFHFFFSARANSQPVSLYLSHYFHTGTTYRTREEVGGVRTARDPIEYVKKLLLDYSLCTSDELKAMEKDIRNSVQDSLTAAKAGG